MRGRGSVRQYKARSVAQNRYLAVSGPCPVCGLSCHRPHPECVRAAEGRLAGSPSDRGRFQTVRLSDLVPHNPKGAV